MSRNRCDNTCDCGYPFTAIDAIGMSVEARAYDGTDPILGCRVKCPECGTLFFGHLMGWSHSASGIADTSYYETFNDEPPSSPHKGAPFFLWSPNGDRPTAKRIYSAVEHVLTFVDNDRATNISTGVRAFACEVEGRARRFKEEIEDLYDDWKYGRFSAKGDK